LGEAVTLQAVRARREQDAFGIAQCKCKIGRALRPRRGIDLEAAQDDLLQGGRHVLAPDARRYGIAPQPAAPLRRAFRIAERALAGGQEIQDHAEREEIATRVVAYTEHLLGRYIGAGA